MTVRATLASRALTVVPGESITFELQLDNDGAREQVLKLVVKGAAAPYSWVAPDTVTVGPGQRGGARVGFHMPRSSVPAAGPLGFQVVVTPVVAGDGANSVITEGVLEVAPFSALSATLNPSGSGGRGETHHELNVSNRGNSAVEVRVEVRSEGGDGVRARIEPATVSVAPGKPATVSVDVEPGARPLTGPERRRAFTVVATPDVGEPVETEAGIVQEPRVAKRTLVTSGVVVGLALLAVVLRATVFAGDSSSETTAGDPASAGAPSACPAEGHKDTFGVSGLRPGDIPKLPNTFSFFSVRGDGCLPVRFNPCEPVHYIQNLALAPPTGAADVREAFAKLSAATGIQFIDDGVTDETTRRSASAPNRYPGRWAPILVNWSHMGGPNATGDIQVVGRGIGLRAPGSEVLVSGTLALNVDAVTDKDARTPLEGGFGPQLGTGAGAIGAKGVTWGRVILHELAHVAGLGHTRDKGAIMYPETAEQTSRPAEFRAPDLEGLRYLGREAGCVTTPPPPGA